MSKTIDKLISEISADTKGLQKGVKQSESHLKRLAGVGNTIKHVFQVAIASAVIKAGFDIAKSAATAKDAWRAFSSVARNDGLDAVAVFKRLEEAAGGTVSRVQLLQKATMGSFLGIDLKQMPELLQISRGIAKATGESVEYMFDSFVRGIGRMSPLILDNLGITVKMSDANEVYAEKLGKAVKELTETEKKQAFMNMAIEQGQKQLEALGGMQETNLDKMQKLGPAIKDLTDKLGGLVDTPISGFVSGLAAAMKGMESTLDTLKNTAVDLGLVRSEIEKTLITLIKLPEVSNKIEDFNKRLEYLKQIRDKILSGDAKLIDKENIRKYFQVYDFSSSKAEAAWKDFSKSLEGRIAETLQKEIEYLEDEGTQKIVKWIEDINKKLDKDNVKIKVDLETGDIKVIEDITQKQLSDMELIAQLRKNEFQKEIKEINDKYDKLKEEFQTKKGLIELEKERVKALNEATKEYVKQNEELNKMRGVSKDLPVSKVSESDKRSDVDLVKPDVSAFDKVTTWIRENTGEAGTLARSFSEVAYQMKGVDNETQRFINSIIDLVIALVNQNPFQIAAVGINFLGDMLGIFGDKSEEAAKRAREQEEAQRKMAQAIKESNQTLEEFTNTLNEKTLKTLIEQYEEMTKLYNKYHTTTGLKRAGYAADILVKYDFDVTTYQGELNFNKAIRESKKAIESFASIDVSTFSGMVDKLKKDFKYFDVNSPAERIKSIIDAFIAFAGESNVSDLAESLKQNLTPGNIESMISRLYDEFLKAKFQQSYERGYNWSLGGLDTYSYSTLLSDYLGADFDLTQKEYFSFLDLLKNLVSQFDQPAEQGRETVAQTFAGITANQAAALIEETRVQTVLMQKQVELQKGIYNNTGALAGGSGDVFGLARATG